MVRPAKKFVPGQNKISYLPNDVVEGFCFGKPGNLTKPDSAGDVEEKIRVFSEMRFLGKIRDAILDFCRACRKFSEIWCEIGF